MTRKATVDRLRGREGCNAPQCPSMVFKNCNTAYHMPHAHQTHSHCSSQPATTPPATASPPDGHDGHVVQLALGCVGHLARLRARW